MAKNFWDDSPLASDDDGSWWETSPLAEPAAEPTVEPDAEVVTSARAWRGAGAGRGAATDPRRTDAPNKSGSVLEGVRMEEPQFDAAEAGRLSNRKYAETALTADDPRRNAPSMTAATDKLIPINESGVMGRSADLVGSQVVSYAAGLGRKAGDAAAAVGATDVGASLNKRAGDLQARADRTQQSVSLSADGAWEKYAPQILSVFPTMAVAAVSGGLPIMFGVAEVQSYAESRQAGLSPLEALGRAVPMGAAEVLGEKLGGTGKLLDALEKVAAKGATTDTLKELGRRFATSGMREVPSEEATYAMQFGVDKLPGVGLNQDAGVAEFVEGAKDTAIVAAGAGSMMGGAGAAASRLPTRAPQQSAMELAQSKGFLVPEAKPAGVTSFSDPNGPVAKAGITPVVIPTSAGANAPTQITEAPNVSAPTATGRLADGGIDGGGDNSAPGLADAGRVDDGATGGSVDTSLTGQSGNGITPVRVPSGEPTAAVKPVSGTSDAALLSRVPTEASTQAQAVLPEATVYARSGDGYATTADAGIALKEFQRRHSGLAWSIEPIDGGRFRLAGYAIQESANDGKTQTVRNASHQPAGPAVEQGIAQPTATGPTAAPAVSGGLAASTREGDSATGSKLSVLARSGQLPASEAPYLGEPDAGVERHVAKIGESIAEAFGVSADIVAYRDERPEGHNGFEYNKRVFLNTHGLQLNAAHVGWHETHHVLQRSAERDDGLGLKGTPAQRYRDQVDSLYDSMSDIGKRNYLTNFLRQAELSKLDGPAQEKAIQGYLADPETRKEMVADFVGNRATDRKFIASLAQADPAGFKAFAEKWLKVIDNLIQQLRGNGKNKESKAVDGYVADLNKARMVLRDAMVELRKSGVSTEAAPGKTIQASAKQSESASVTLSAATSSIPGLKKLQAQANDGDKSAQTMLNDVASNSLKRLLSGITSAKVQYNSNSGLYFGELEPSLGLQVNFDAADRDAVLAALAKFADNFNQHQLHVRQATSDSAGTKYPDGSFASPGFKITLKRPLSRTEVQAVVDGSGLVGLTYNDKMIEAYYVGKPEDANGIEEFERAVDRAVASIGGNGASHQRETYRLWPYGNTIEGLADAIPYSAIAGNVRTGPAKEDPTAKLVAERLVGRSVSPASQQDITPQQRKMQEGIARAYEAMPLNDLANPDVRRAYEALVDELGTQYDAMPIKTEVQTKKKDGKIERKNGVPVAAGYEDGGQYNNSEEMRRDVLDNNHIFIFATTPESFGPPGVTYDDHPMLRDSGRKDQNGYPLLFNDLLRAVHDYIAHTMSPVEFGPRGEEAAWKNHMATTKSPWAKWALTSETRGQNSWVNFRSGVEKIPVKDRPFSDQKVGLLPIEMTMVGDHTVDQAMIRMGQDVGVSRSKGSLKGVQYSRRQATNIDDINELGNFNIDAQNAEDYDLDFTDSVTVTEGTDGLTPGELNAKMEAKLTDRLREELEFKNQLMAKIEDELRDEGFGVIGSTRGKAPIPVSQRPVDLSATNNKAIKVSGIMAEEAYPDLNYRDDVIDPAAKIAPFSIAGKSYTAKIRTLGSPTIGDAALADQFKDTPLGMPLPHGLADLSEAAKKAWNKRFSAGADLFRRGFDLYTAVPADARARVLKAWQQIAAKPGAFEFNRDEKPSGKTVEDVAQGISNKMLAGTRYSAAIDGHPRQAGNDVHDGFQIILTDKKTGDVGTAEIEYRARDKRVVVHAEALGKGSSMGKPVYQIAQAFATAFKSTITSHELLMGVNNYRRTEQMFSGALRSGNIATMQPGVGQRIYGWNERAKDQTQQDRNLVRMALASARNAAEFAPDIKHYAYDLATDEFVDTRQADTPRNRAMAADDIKQMLRDPDARQASISRSTLARAAVTFDAIEHEVTVPDAVAKPVLYSKKQTETPEFKLWFGDSKVVNTDGSPMVVYHGTPHAGFAAFDPTKAGTRGTYDSARAGMYFTSQPRYANGLARSTTETAPGVYPVYLSIQNPLRVFSTDTDNAAEVDAMIEAARDGGHDGIIDEMWNFVAFRPEQIKSAIGNSGAFDQENPDIRYSARQRPVDRELASWAQAIFSGENPRGDDAVLSRGAPHPAYAMSSTPIGMRQPFVLTKGVVRHIAKHVHEGITSQMIGMLPDAIKEPRAIIFDRAGEFVALLPLRAANGQPVLMAATKDALGATKITRLASLYPLQNSASYLVRAMKEGSRIWLPSQEVNRLRDLLAGPQLAVRSDSSALAKPKTASDERGRGRGDSVGIVLSDSALVKFNAGDKAWSLATEGVDIPAGAEKALQGVNFSARQRPPGLPGESKFMAFRRVMQDQFIQVKVLQNMLTKRGGTVGEAQDVYRAEERSHGRVQALLIDFANHQIAPFIDKVAAAGFDINDVALYAYALHAKERNAYIQSINPKIGDAGSGMSDIDSDNIVQMAQLSGDKAALDDLQQDLMAIAETTRRVLLDEGLITQEEFDGWSNLYQNYVPLRGFENVDPEDGTPRPGAGRGFSMTGKESIKALGRKSRAGDIIENIVRDYERAVIRSERNSVAKTFLDLATSNPDPALWEVQPVKINRSFNKASGMVLMSKSPDTGDDTVAIKVAGQSVRVKIHDELFLRAMKLAGKDETSQLERLIADTLGTYTNLMRNTLTRYNPIFGAINAVRDGQMGAVSIFDELGAKGLKLYTKYYTPSLAASWRSERDKPNQAKVMDRWMQEMRFAGGSTGGYHMRDVSEITESMQTMLLAAGAAPHNWRESVRGSKAWQGAAAAMKWLEIVGATSEDAARVAAYRAAREMGKTPAEAASISKNLTTNFNRKGEWGTTINGLYLFFNAAVQGSTRVLEALQNPKVRYMMAGVTAAAMGIALANASAGDDDDGQPYWDKIPAFEKERNMIFMLPAGVEMEGATKVGTRGRYIKVPMPYGINVFPVLGNQLADLARHAKNPSNGVGPAKAAINMMSAVFGSINPFGGALDPTKPVELGMALAPTAADLVIQLATGTNAFGRPVGPEKSPFDDKPDSENFSARQAGTASQSVARWLNSVTGGNEARSGAIDLMPGTLDNLVRNTTGGFGVFLADTFVNLPTKIMSPVETTSRDIPLARNFFGQIDEVTDIGLFYDRRSEVAKEADAAKAEMKLGIPVDYSDEQLAKIALAKSAESLTKLMSMLRKREIEIAADANMTKGEKQLARREIESKRASIAQAFNTAYVDKQKELAEAGGKQKAASER